MRRNRYKNKKSKLEILKEHKLVILFAVGLLLLLFTTGFTSGDSQKKRGDFLSGIMSMYDAYDTKEKAMSYWSKENFD